MVKIADSQKFPDSDEVFREGKLYYKNYEIFATPQVHSTAIEIIERYLTPPSKVLELGAGTGAFTLRLQEKGFSVSASGNEPDSFKLAEVPFCFLDLNLELPEEHIGRYEAVVAIEVIEHVENIYEFFRKFKQLLKPNGWSFISTPNIMNVRSRLMFLHSGNFYTIHPQMFKQWGHIQVLPHWLLSLAAERATLQFQEVISIGKLRMDLHLRWQKIITSMALLFKKIFYKEKFPNEFSSSHLLIVLRKRG